MNRSKEGKWLTSKITQLVQYLTHILKHFFQPLEHRHLGAFHILLVHGTYLVHISFHAYIMYMNYSHLFF
jgi:hypothetical protein